MRRIVDARAANSFVFGMASSHSAMALMATAIYKAPSIAQYLERAQGAVISPEFATAMLGLASWNICLLVGTMVIASGLFLLSRQVRTPAHDRLRDMVGFGLGAVTGIVTGFVLPASLNLPTSQPNHIEMSI